MGFFNRTNSQSQRKSYKKIHAEFKGVCVARKRGKINLTVKCRWGGIKGINKTCHKGRGTTFASKVFFFCLSLFVLPIVLLSI